MPQERKYYLKANIKIYPLPDTPGPIFLWSGRVPLRGGYSRMVHGGGYRLRQWVPAHP
ncbi:MAG: hypothetical protein AVDCRST_MAG56-3664 [uncultured Cytophagales bacterium]|uniref:Uncharacterized protein n=1 Tax=uncultured Cytophagales bacterium TaxID=158755 RepID=A0A6J4JGM2_9SPHI|nr:MAG: hypothetical protein AVDCRST_MAG56-3664 [uncultured Cytophagales bacterium]